MAGTVLGVGSVLLESSDVSRFLEAEWAGGPTPDPWGSQFANLHLQACARQSSCKECPAYSSDPSSPQVCMSAYCVLRTVLGTRETATTKIPPPPKSLISRGSA